MSEVGGDGQTEALQPVDQKTWDERLVQAQQDTDAAMRSLRITTVSFTRVNGEAPAFHRDDVDNQTLQRKETEPVVLQPRADSDGVDFPRIAHLARTSLVSGGLVGYEIEIKQLDGQTGETQGSPVIVGLSPDLDTTSSDALTQITGYETALAEVQQALGVIPGQQSHS